MGGMCIYVVLEFGSEHFLVGTKDKHRNLVFHAFEKACEVSHHLSEYKNARICFDFPGFEVCVVNGHMHRFALLNQLQINDVLSSLARALAH